MDVKWLNWATRGYGSVVAMPSLVFPLFTTNLIQSSKLETGKIEFLKCLELRTKYQVLIDGQVILLNSVSGLNKDRSLLLIHLNPLVE